MLRYVFALAAAALAPLSGCSFLPSAPSAPEFNPGASGKAAIEAYDQNGDSAIDRTEAEQSPALVIAFERIDKDGDSTLSEKEIADRVRYYKNADTTIVDGGVMVTLGGKRIPGAEVTFEPEEFLGEAFVPCTGTTDEFGVAYVDATGSEFPGLYLGLYRVRISRPSKGEEMIPSRYNTETTLGYEAADDIEGVSRGIEFHLDRK